MGDHVSPSYVPANCEAVCPKPIHMVKINAENSPTNAPLKKIISSILCTKMDRWKPKWGKLTFRNRIKIRLSRLFIQVKRKTTQI